MPNKKKLLQFLRSQRLLTLAVCEESKPWVNTAYYYIDDEFNLYIFTSPETIHGKIIKKNKNVACNIYNSSQKVTDKKVGAQIQGKISEIKGVNSIKWALKMWHSANPGLQSIINYNNMKKRIVSGRVFKITPKKIKFYNEALYKDKDEEIFNF